MRYFLATLCVLLATAALLAGTGQGGSQPQFEVQGSPEALRDVGIDQRLDEQVPLDLTFRDEEGSQVRLGDFFDGKPVILVLAYYRCPKLCNQVLNGLLDAARILKFDAGKDFNIVIVSFDPREKPELAAAKKQSYVEHYGRPDGEQGWHFLTGEPASIESLTRAVGFHYSYDAKQDLYAHASGIMILTPKGKLARYLFGIHYAPRDLRLSLVEASANRIGSPVDQILLLCYHYDAQSGKYTLIMDVVRLGGILTVVGLAGFMGLSWYRNWRKASKPACLKT